MTKLKEFKFEFVRKKLNPSKEIQRVIREKKRVRQKELLPLINEARKRIAESVKTEAPNMSPSTLHKHLERLKRDGAIRKIVVSHKEVYYEPGPRSGEEWTNSYIIEGVARLLNSLDRRKGLIEAIRLFEKIRKKPGRIKELENSIRMLCRVFDKELPESTEDDWIVLQVHQEGEE